MTRADLLAMIGIAPLAVPAVIGAAAAVAEKTAPEWQYSTATIGATLAEVEMPAYAIRVAGLNAEGRFVSFAAFEADILPESEAETAALWQRNIGTTTWPGYMGVDRFEIWRNGAAIFQAPIKPGVIPAGWQSEFASTIKYYDNASDMLVPLKYATGSHFFTP